MVVAVASEIASDSRGSGRGHSRNTAATLLPAMRSDPSGDPPDRRKATATLHRQQ